MIPASSFSPQKKATAIAVLFHVIGLTGILFFDRQLFVSLTPFNLLLSAGLLIYTQAEKNKAFFLFVLVCVVVGFTVEYIGVNHQLLFGEYEYLNAMGEQWQRVPLVIGVNWFIMMYCCGVSIQLLLNRMWNKLKGTDQPARKNVGFIAVILDAALLATFFDWVMEPVAVKLGWWKWLGDGSIPLLNYISWFGISALLLLLFRLLSFDKQNQFAVNLLLIQFMFFLILRTVL
ncbi:MAG: carotenoid biosynthesis protein [Chitinophagaceae bacterium]|nr:carotenoid biosynthesis protein [Chitinophagaceae bacterium]